MRAALGRLRQAGGVSAVAVFAPDGRCLASDFRPPYDPSLFGDALSRLSAAGALDDLDWQERPLSVAARCDRGWLLVRRTARLDIVVLAEPAAEQAPIDVAMAVLELALDGTAPGAGDVDDEAPICAEPATGQVARGATTLSPPPLSPDAEPAGLRPRPRRRLGRARQPTVPGGFVSPLSDRAPREDRQEAEQGAVPAGGRRGLHRIPSAAAGPPPPPRRGKRKQAERRDAEPADEPPADALAAGLAAWVETPPSSRDVDIRAELASIADEQHEEADVAGGSEPPELPEQAADSEPPEPAGDEQREDDVLPPAGIDEPSWPKAPGAASCRASTRQLVRVQDEAASRRSRFAPLVLAALVVVVLGLLIGRFAPRDTDPLASPDDPAAPAGSAADPSLTGAGGARAGGREVHAADPGAADQAAASGGAPSGSELADDQQVLDETLGVAPDADDGPPDRSKSAGKSKRARAPKAGPRHRHAPRRAAGGRAADKSATAPPAAATHARPKTTARGRSGGEFSPDGI